MRGFLAEHSGVFIPDEVGTLVAAFDIGRGGPFKPAEWSTQRLRPKPRGRYSQSILLRLLRTVSVATPDCVMARYWLWLNQIYGTCRSVRRGRPRSGCG